MAMILLLPLLCALAADVPLFNGKNLDGWAVAGDGQWTVMADGTLLGQRTADVRKVLAPGATFQTKKEYEAWENTQSWLYTTKDSFEEFDLHVEFWTRTNGNSGISIRDPSRAQYGISTPPDYKRTPSKLGYEIQINNRYPDPHPTGSIYGFADAKPGSMREDDWNSLDISSRHDKISVRLNGQLVAEHAGDPQRPKSGPIGLQLHDQFSVVMFRNIRIRELAGR